MRLAVDRLNVDQRRARERFFDDRYIAIMMRKRRITVHIWLELSGQFLPELAFT
jgi:hypothetical protein